MLPDAAATLGQTSVRSDDYGAGWTEGFSMGGQRIRMVVVAALVLVGGVGASGCGWRPGFDVDSFDFQADANPGDGICETVDPGVCTLRAAIDEANATGLETDISVPDGWYHLNPTLADDFWVTGKVRINWGHPGNTEIEGLQVAAGGQVLIDGLHVFYGDPPVVDGVLHARRSSIASFAPALRIGPTGVAVVQSTTLLQPFGHQAVVNEGRLLLRHATLVSGDALAVPIVGPLENVGTGTTTMWSSAILGLRSSGGPVTGPACTGGGVVSMGGNAAFDTSCGLTAPGDVEDIPVATTASTVDPGVWLIPAAGSALVDAVPIGSNGCGVDDTIALDQRGSSRPVDGDGDGVAACDIGAVEVP
jgi:hypothetical protein